MSVTFSKSPLVELIAEVRWPVNIGIGVELSPQGLVGSHSDSGNHEDLYLRLGSILYSRGYNRVERIVPPGFQVSPHQTVVRYRKDSSPEIIQIGAGVFTVNAVQPYTSWAAFGPVVRAGLESLMLAAPPLGAKNEFHASILRYVDAFTEQQMGVLGNAKFARDILRFNIDAPEAVSKYFARDAESVLNLRAELKGGKKFQLTTGPAEVAGNRSYLLDMSLITEGPIEANVDSVMSTFDTSRDIAHDMFVTMTQPIHQTMGKVNQ